MGLLDETLQFVNILVHSWLAARQRDMAKERQLIAGQWKEGSREEGN